MYMRVRTEDQLCMTYIAYQKFNTDLDESKNVKAGIKKVAHYVQEVGSAV